MPPDCIFNAPPQTPLRFWDTEIGSCSGSSSSLRDVNMHNCPLYGAKDSLDLLLLRGGIVVNWADLSEVNSARVLLQQILVTLEDFSGLVESTEEAKIAVREDSILPLVSGNKLEEKRTGWALRRTERNGALDAGVKKEVERMVKQQLDGGKRAEAREIRDHLRDLRLPDGSYRFPLKKCLSESQIKSQITRILNLKKKETGDGDQETEKTPTRRPSKRSVDEMEKEQEDPCDGDEDEFDCLEAMESVVERMIDDIFEKD